MDGKFRKLEGLAQELPPLMPLICPTPTKHVIDGKVLTATMAMANSKNAMARIANLPCMLVS